MDNKDMYICNSSFYDFFLYETEILLTNISFVICGNNMCGYMVEKRQLKRYNNTLKKYL